MLVLAMILWYDTQSTNNKNETQQVKLHQTTKLLQSQRNDQQNEEATYETEENIYKPSI